MTSSGAQRGRPTLYTPELAAEIAERMAEGESLRAVCKADGMPAESTVRLWALSDVGGFAAQYARAMQLRAMRWSEEIMEIADDGKNDTYEDGEGGTETNYDVIARSRLRVDTRKWIVSKLLPKVYGDRPESGDAPDVIAAAIRAFVKAARQQDTAEGEAGV